MRPAAFLAAAVLLLAGCGSRKPGPGAGGDEKTAAAGAEVPELILVRRTNAERMWPSMIIHKTFFKFFGTANDLTMLGSDNTGFLLSFARLPLSKSQEFPDYNAGQCFSVEVIYKGRTVRGFLFHRTQSELGNWFDKNLPDKKFLLLH